jgi:nucleoside-diphosphate-sugar epimerase
LKKVLITGANSYVGTNVEKWLMKDPENFYVESISVRGDEWKSFDFSKFDVVFHVAGIVHLKENEKNKDIFININRDLAIEVSNKAKNANVSQFIFMSSMSVYGEEGRLGKEVVINKNTPVNPKTSYGLSKFLAEIELLKANSESFKVVVLRPPMIYGPNCPGNYVILEKLAMKLPIFPFIKNKRSVLHVRNLCQFVEQYIKLEVEGLFLPQDEEYINTSLFVKEIAENFNKTIHLSRTAGIIIKIFFKRVRLIKKAFGNLVYEK